MRYLPSKKFLVVALSLLIILGAEFFVSNKNKPDTGKNSDYPSKNGFLSGLFGSGQKDSDADGLMDWEETLWKTNPNDKDTDKDGTSDKEEIEQKRNPLKAGPDDKIEETVFSAKNNSDEAQVLNETEIFARNFFASFLSLYQSGKLDEETKSSLTEAFLKNFKSEVLPDKYSSSDLKITSGSSASILKNYGNQTTKIINNRKEGLDEDETEIIARALEEKNENEIKKLDRIAEIYKNTAADLINISVPSDISDEHLELINGIYNLSASLENTKELLNDPIKGMAGLNQYQENYLRVKRALLEISRYFTQKTIFFNKTEDGYSFWINNRSQ